MRITENADAFPRRWGTFPPSWGSPPPLEQYDARVAWILKNIRANVASNPYQELARRDARLANILLDHLEQIRECP